MHRLISLVGLLTLHKNTVNNNVALRKLYIITTVGRKYILWEEKIIFLLPVRANAVKSLHSY